MKSATTEERNMEATTARLSHVETIEREDGYRVSPIWANVDRPNVGGWNVPLANRNLADRLERAILAGAAIENPEVRTDVNGQTYVSATHTVRGRALNADLRRLGF